MYPKYKNDIWYFKCCLCTSIEPKWLSANFFHIWCLFTFSRCALAMNLALHK